MQKTTKLSYLAMFGILVPSALPVSAGSAIEAIPNLRLQFNSFSELGGDDARFKSTEKEEGLKYLFSSGLTYDTNVFGTSGELEDWRWDTSLKVSSEFDLTPKLRWAPLFQVTDSRYDDFTGLDRNSVSAGLALKYDCPCGASLVGQYKADWFYGNFFDGKFFERQTLSVGLVKDLGEWNDWKFTGKVEVGRVFSSNDNYEAWIAAAGVEAKRDLGDGWNLAASASVGFNDYDGYFGMSRSGFTTAFNAGVSKDTGGGGRLTLGVAYKNSSNDLPLFDYDQLTVGPTFTYSF